MIPRRLPRDTRDPHALRARRDLRNIRDVLERTVTADHMAIAIILDQGGKIRSAEESRREITTHPIASVRHAGLTGIGPSIMAAAADWRRQAVRAAARADDRAAA